MWQHVISIVLYTTYYYRLNGPRKRKIGMVYSEVQSNNSLAYFNHWNYFSLLFWLQLGNFIGDVTTACRGILFYKRLLMFDKHLWFSKHFWYKHFSINVLGKLDIKYQLIYEIIYFYNCETIHKTTRETE